MGPMILLRGTQIGRFGSVSGGQRDVAIAA
jgi:hypothetical protein